MYTLLDTILSFGYKPSGRVIKGLGQKKRGGRVQPVLVDLGGRRPTWRGTTRDPKPVETAFGIWPYEPCAFGGADVARTRFGPTSLALWAGRYYSDLVIYLDHNATTPILPEVLEAMMPYLTTEWGNPAKL